MALLAQKADHWITESAELFGKKTHFQKRHLFQVIQVIISNYCFKLFNKPSL